MKSRNLGFDNHYCLLPNPQHKTQSISFLILSQSYLEVRKYMHFFSCEAHFSYSAIAQNISNRKMKKISTVAEKLIFLTLALLWFPNFSKGQIFTGCNYDTLYRHPAEVGFICTFSLSISPSITLRSSKFIISSKYFHLVFYLK